MPWHKRIIEYFLYVEIEGVTLKNIHQKKKKNSFFWEELACWKCLHISPEEKSAKSRNKKFDIELKSEFPLSCCFYMPVTDVNITVLFFVCVCVNGLDAIFFG